MRFQFEETAPGFFVRKDCKEILEDMNLCCLDDVFQFNGGENLHKNNLAAHRSRIKFMPKGQNFFMFLKRYKKTPVLTQIKNWISHKKRELTADYDRSSCERLSEAGINTPETLAYGGKWKGIFEDRSFYISRQIENAQSLETKLPDCLTKGKTNLSREKKKEFISALASFIKKFHDTGFRHRDLYLAHIFHDSQGEFHLIDLHRCFRPGLLSKRFLVKDLAQLHYSSPAEYISSTDRMRFIRNYFKTKKLNVTQKKLIQQIVNKAWRMARHDIKHGRTVPFIS